MKSLLLRSSFALTCLAGCTVIKYESETAKFTAIDFHPTGNTLALDAMAPALGTLNVNREQGSATADAVKAVDILTPQLPDSLIPQ